MGQGSYSHFSATVLSGATISSAFDLQRTWENVYLQIPSMTSNTQIHIQGATEINGTYRRVRHPSLNSSTVENNVFAIASAATNCMVPIPNGFRYIKVETTATVDGSAAFEIVCGD